MKRGSEPYRAWAKELAYRAELALERLDELREEMVAAARLELEDGVDFVSPPDQLRGFPTWITSHYGSMVHDARKRLGAINDARDAVSLVAGHMGFLAERAVDDD